MLETKKVDYYEIVDVDYNLDQCNQKEEIFEMLNTSTPREVENCDMDFAWCFRDYLSLHTYNFNINGGHIMIPTITENVSTLFNFLEHVAYYDNKNMFVSLHYEGVYQAISVLPAEDKKIRFTIFDYEFMENKKILSDIIINKLTFFTQFKENCLKEAKKIEKLKNNKHIKYEWKEIQDGLSILNEYCNNPQEYKENHKLPIHIRLFNVAYKKPNSDWEFGIYYEGDEKCEIEYWEKEKQEGKILKYDLEEDIPIIKGQKSKKCANGQCYYTYSLNSDRVVNVNRANCVGMRNRVIKKNWCYSTETQKWYSADEEMPEPYLDFYGTTCIPRCYLEIDTTYHSEDSNIESHLSDNTNGYLGCILTIKTESNEDCKLKFDYRMRQEIINGLEKAKAGKYSRFSLSDWEVGDKLHLWQSDKNSMGIAYFKSPRQYDFKNDEKLCHIKLTGKEREQFFTDFFNGLAQIEHKVEVMRKVIESAKKFKLDKKFKFDNADNFIGNYACVGRTFDGAGIIDINGKWVNQPQYDLITGDVHPHFGRELKGIVYKYYYLDNVDGKYFIAQKNDNKKFVMDVNGDIVINSVVDNIYWSKFNEKIYFIFQDDNMSWITDEKGNKLIELDFAVGEKFYLFEDIFICTKDEKYGIVSFKGKNKGKILIDFIFNNIKPPTQETQYIAVRYIDNWGYVSRKGKILNLKLKNKI